MSQVIVLDTHIWLWFINGNTEKIPGGWLDLIATAYQIGISPVSCYEIALAHQKGKLILPTSPKEWFDAAFGATDMELFPLTPEIADQAVNLSPVHRDPFDRIIIATAICLDAKLASVDGLFAQYPELNHTLLT